CYNEGDSW
nr:immunoglobulin heavy chain junction region [Macaca mulatta]MPN71427.1 immunoglobulin heavy chain junction region [Macaca mulatta]MPN71635.1 immunoglobulin heavy chain junction region [Macaca mulatta]MPN71778.1 immunoglobulin heavy chain junction region [Macaca mulatta]MPN72218.1 immunoglobulin heavy chain junction region [Macaca mulatta]